MLSIFSFNVTISSVKETLLTLLFDQANAFVLARTGLAVVGEEKFSFLVKHLRNSYQSTVSRELLRM